MMRWMACHAGMAVSEFKACMPCWKAFSPPASPHWPPVPDPVPKVFAILPCTLYVSMPCTYVGGRGSAIGV